MTTSQVVAGIGSSGVVLAVVGASTTAVSAGAIIAATGGAAAVVLVGYGLYKCLSSDDGKKEGQR